MAICSIDRFLLFVISTTRVGVFDAVSKGCSIPSTLMIFAVRVVLFGRGVQHLGKQAAVLNPGRIDRGAYCQEKEELVVSTRGS